MRSRLFRLTFLGLATASLVSACADDGTSDEVVTTSGNARIIRSESGALTAPSSETAETVARDYLGGRGVDTQGLQLAREIPGANGVTHLVLEQRAGGLRVYGAYVKAAVDANGQLLQVIDATAPVTAIAKSSVDDRAALGAAMKHLGYDGVVPARTGGQGNKSQFAKNADFDTSPEVETVAYLDGASLKQGFLVETWGIKGNQLDYTLVGADGAVVSSERRTNSDRYNVFTVDPRTAQQIVTGPGGARPWLGTGTQTTWAITGNNTKTYLDADGNNRADSGGVSVTNGDFLTAFSATTQPSTTTNKNVAVQNLFYFNNYIHDVLYTAGFTEAAGNFQTNNFGLGGAGADPVLAEAQDGSGTDNANFSTPTDGKSPRMQMYLWTNRTTPAAFVTTGGQSYQATPSDFGAALTSTLNGTLKLAPVNNADGCLSFPSGTFTSRIAVINRGTCNFTVKVYNAQLAGATSVIVVNNNTANPDEVFGMSGTDRKVKITSVMVSNRTGGLLADAAAASVSKNTAPSIMLDGDVDSDIVFHEYGHGLSWRMIGGMSGTLAGAIGEGASDVNAFLVNDDPVVGEYSWQDPVNGIRRYSYEGYPLTYSNWTGAEVHDDGEIYAAAMWKVRTNYRAAGITNDELRADWVNGMNFTPSTPTPEAMRDGMLQAVGANSTKACAIWRGFAAQGIGVGAKGVAGASTVTVTESFTVPATCP